MYHKIMQCTQTHVPDSTLSKWRILCSSPAQKRVLGTICHGCVGPLMYVSTVFIIGLCTENFVCIKEPGISGSMGLYMR